MQAKPTKVKRQLLRGLPLVGLAIFLLHAVSFSVWADSDGAEEERKLKALKARIESLQKEIQSRTADRDKESQALRNTEVAAGKLRKQIHGSEQKLSALRKELADLQKQRTELQAAKHEQEGRIGQHLNAAYRLGREEQIKLLLNAEDPARFNRLLKYHDYFVQARADKIKTFLSTIETLSEVEKSIAAKEQQQLAERDSLTEKQAQLNQQIKERQKIVASLNSAITSDQKNLSKLHSERKALEEVLRELEKAITDLAMPQNNQPFAKRQGKMSWPVKGRVTKRFGNSRTADIRWNGWLMSAREGTSVHAVHHGRVVFSDYLRGHGLLLIIDHGDGYMSLYAHNQVLLKDTGDWVQSGELISRVGDSGGLGETALYFEIRKDGKPRNPAKWLSSK
ncbi:peptidoglycan DD-metalloendopeptidase family protein [Porticoccaceae bacterium LTM1]|nr:peptidoglycan DD-metalloendopeptidase family protein [Porticoccaceae bacterium LTM1]